MIVVLVLGLALRADPPVPPGAPPDDASATVSPKHASPRTKKKPDPKAVTPGPEPSTRKEPDGKDEEVIRNLDLLESLPLLDRLELFDTCGDRDAKRSDGR